MGGQVRVVGLPSALIINILSELFLSSSFISSGPHVIVVIFVLLRVLVLIVDIVTVTVITVEASDTVK